MRKPGPSLTRERQRPSQDEGCANASASSQVAAGQVQGALPRGGGMDRLPAYTRRSSVLLASLEMNYR